MAKRSSACSSSYAEGWESLVFPGRSRKGIPSLFHLHSSLYSTWIHSKHMYTSAPDQLMVCIGVFTKNTAAYNSTTLKHLRGKIFQNLEATPQMSCTYYLGVFQALPEPFLRAQSLASRIWGSGPYSDEWLSPFPPLQMARLPLQNDYKVPMRAVSTDKMVM